jgi:hypothetical protein
MQVLIYLGLKEEFLLYLDRFWDEISTDIGFMTEFKIQNVDQQFLKQMGFVDGTAFKKNPFLLQYGLDDLPFFDLNISNTNFLDSLNVFHSFNLQCASWIAQFYPNYLKNSTDSEIISCWKKFYHLTQNAFFGNVIRTVYFSDSGYLNKNQLVYQGDSKLAKLLNFTVVSSIYPDLKNLFVEQIGINYTFTLKNIIHGLRTISNRSHKNEYIDSLSGDELMNLITSIYECKETSIIVLILNIS